MTRFRSALLTSVLGAVAFAGPSGAQTPEAPVPYGELTREPVPYEAGRSAPVAQDATGLAAALRAARFGDLSAGAYLSDPVQRKIARWAVIDVAGERLSFAELDAARREMRAWPRGQRRDQLAEQKLDTAGLAPAAVIAWFEGRRPLTAEGAMTLADALRATGRDAEAQTLVRSFWREELFDSEPQARFQARFGGWLTQDDHVARLNTLLLGPQGPATQGVMALVSDDHRALAEARMALRRNSSRANELYAAVPAAVAGDRGLAFERARYLRNRNLDTLGMELLANFPAAPAHEDGQDRLWTERKLYLIQALRAQNWRAAYAAMNGHGFQRGEPLVEAEFYAGWVALTKLRDAATAARHFEALERGGTTPVTRARAAYWRGRAAEALGDAAAARTHYEAGARWPTTFYGQLAAEKAGLKTITLGADPVPTEEDRARFEGRELVQAARALAQAGEDNLLETFVRAIDDELSGPAEAALLVDFARNWGDQDLSMKAVRDAFGKGWVLPERGYPLRRPPSVPTSAEPALVLAVTRQESGFDPMVRSGADARGMMQLLPATARVVARRLGVSWEVGRLWEPDYNMSLGAYHLGELIDGFSGSYVMAAAGYNAGPGRPPQWAGDCGDPRGGATDPLDFIECIPFSETRNYVMRVMENTAVYRARLNGGTAPLTPMADLRRGGYGGPRPYVSSAY